MSTRIQRMTDSELDALAERVIADHECVGNWCRGWFPVWIDDPEDRFMGGFEYGEAYCHCERGQALKGGEG